MRLSMRLTRRDAIRTIAGTALAAPFLRSQEGPAIAPGPFQPTRESLRAYRVPKWFYDAKFGIWAHWGPQSAPEYGDWYARNIYLQNTRQNRFHVQHYGHPSRFGYKDIVQTWKGDLFDPDHLVGLYKNAGAKYFVS